MRGLGVELPARALRRQRRVQPVFQEALHHVVEGARAASSDAEAQLRFPWAVPWVMLKSPSSAKHVLRCPHPVRVPPSSPGAEAWDGREGQRRPGAAAAAMRRGPHGFHMRVAPEIRSVRVHTVGKAAARAWSSSTANTAQRPSRQEHVAQNAPPAPACWPKRALKSVKRGSRSNSGAASISLAERDPLLLTHQGEHDPGAVAGSGSCRRARSVPPACASAVPLRKSAAASSEAAVCDQRDNRGAGAGPASPGGLVLRALGQRRLAPRRRRKCRSRHPPRACRSCGERHRRPAFTETMPGKGLGDAASVQGRSPIGAGLPEARDAETHHRHRAWPPPTPRPMRGGDAGPEGLDQHIGPRGELRLRGQAAFFRRGQVQHDSLRLPRLNAVLHHAVARPPAWSARGTNRRLGRLQLDDGRRPDCRQQHAAIGAGDALRRIQHEQCPHRAAWTFPVIRCGPLILVRHMVFLSGCRLSSHQIAKA